MNRFDQFMRHFMDMDEVLKGMSRYGVLTDPQARCQFKDKLTSDIKNKEKELHEKVPALANPKDKVYKRVPSEFRCKQCKGNGFTVKVRSKNKVKSRVIEGCEDCEGKGFLADKIPATKVLGEDVGTFEPTSRTVKGEDGIKRPQWRLKFAFNSKSTVQVQSYLSSQCYPLPKHRKTGLTTTGEKDLEALARKHNDPILWLILGIRELRTMRDTFMGHSYDPDEDGRIRANFGFKPRTGRLNAFGPNIQQVPKRNPTLAKAFRKQFIASEGHLLYERDYSSIEAIITGTLAKDEKFIQATAHSIHAILCSYMLGSPIDLKWPVNRIRKAVRGLKREHPGDYSKAKEVIYLSLYGGKPRMIFYRNPGIFKSIAEATKLQNLFFETLATGVRRWQYLSLIEADEKSYLDTPYGYWHWFWEPMAIKPEKGNSLIWTRNRAKARLLEGDLTYAKKHIKFTSSSDKVLAFRSQSIAASKLKDDCLTMAEDKELGPTMRWVIHDAFINEIPEDKIIEYDKRIFKIMSRPILNGLRIGSEATSGRNWGEMEEMVAEVD